jgi:hypothetical protein
MDQNEEACNRGLEIPTFNSGLSKLLEGFLVFSFLFTRLIVCDCILCKRHALGETSRTGQRMVMP